MSMAFSAGLGCTLEERTVFPATELINGCTGDHPYALPVLFTEPSAQVMRPWHALGRKECALFAEDGQ